jgi:hypothetical protein
LTAIDEDSTALDLDATTIGAVNTVNDKNGYRLSAMGVDDIWDEAQSGHTTAGTFGRFLDEAISGLDDNPWDNGTRTLTALDEDSTTLDLDATTIGTVTNVSDKSGYSLSATGVDAIWDEAQSGHTTAGTFGKYLDAQVSSVGGGLTAGSIADAVWDEAASEHMTAGTMGKKLNDAGAAADPWATALPGSYGAGTAGKILSNINDATDGDQESGAYTGIEKTIRAQR